MAIKAVELNDPNSCINKAADDEPVFVLRANDENAAPAVAAWARDYIVSKGGWGVMTKEQRAKYTEAMDIVGAMRIWLMHKHRKGTVR
jgi:hypothetical protein